MHRLTGRIGTFLAAGICTGTCGAAMAQLRSLDGPGVVTPVEIGAEMVNSNRRCRAPRAHLPAKYGQP